MTKHRCIGSRNSSSTWHRVRTLGFNWFGGTVQTNKQVSERVKYQGKELGEGKLVIYKGLGHVQLYIFLDLYECEQHMLWPLFHAFVWASCLFPINISVFCILFNPILKLWIFMFSSYQCLTSEMSCPEKVTDAVVLMDRHGLMNNSISWACIWVHFLNTRVGRAICKRGSRIF